MTTPGPGPLPSPVPASVPPPVTSPPNPARRHLAALVIGCLLLLPGLGMLLGGAGVVGAYAFGRDSAGYLALTLPSVHSATPAVTAEDVIVQTGPDVPAWVLDRLDLDVRLAVTPSAGGAAVFVGVAPEAQLTAYLDGVAHDQVVGVTEPRNGAPRAAVLRTTPGANTASAPTGQTFWTSAVTGTGRQQLTWQVTGGQWAAAIMNADGSAGIDVAATLGVRAGFLLPLGLLLLGIGLVVTGLAVALVIRGARTGGPSRGEPAPGAGVPAVPSPLGSAAHGTSAAPEPWHTHARAVSPVALDARLDAPLSRWLWLVKWFLAIPHVVVLALLWVAFVVVSVVAFVAILLTGRYPRGLFDFNVGVLRWSWRVGYYCGNGGLGTDRYPPFSLDDDPDYPAHLSIAYPERLSRGLVLVKWWLLAIPHYLILGLLVGGSWGWTAARDEGWRVDPVGGGILGLLVVVAGLFLLFTDRYPRSLFDLVVGLNRWVYRVVAYAALMTDAYPPFQLDEGGAETPPPPPTPPVPPDRVDSRQLTG
ncbi:hypothetical protein GCM10023258_04730 [Terrabacter aeriphilus]|uniref:DUF4389 domain-containing protein n=1 Tax=Terrabacter aeriphilus TaxID=515662 RepID=A0ABP9J405_9MICO